MKNKSQDAIRYLSKSLIRGGQIVAVWIALGASALRADPAHPHHFNHSQADNSDLKEARFRLGGSLFDAAAYSLAAEVGARTQRASGNIAYAISSENAIKVSAEYLSQKLNYDFIGDTTESRNCQQSAFGLAYQRRVNLGCLSSFVVAVGRSSTVSKNLSRSLSEYFADFRRLAGTKFYSGSLGATLSLWKNAEATVTGYMDYFKIDNIYLPTRSETGVGIGVNLNQKFNEYLYAEVNAQCRRAYNTYGASINYLSGEKWWVVGAFVECTEARYQLPNSTVMGLQLFYTPDSSGFSLNGGLTEWVNIAAFSQPEVLFAVDDCEAGRPL